MSKKSYKNLPQCCVKLKRLTPEEMMLYSSTNEKVPSVIPNDKKQAVHVLSLFDGIGSGIVALKQLGIKIEKYYAIETDKDAIHIMNIHHGDGGMVHHLGDVKAITKEILRDICPINLLIGGNDLSNDDHVRRGLNGHGSIGLLFFEYYRILTLLEEINREMGIKLYWLYENVASMKEEYKEDISRFLRTDGIQIDAADYSPQRRSRLYWGNIPGLQDIPNQDPPVTACHTLQSVLTPHCHRIALSRYSPPITTNPATNREIVLMGDKLSTLWMNELELMFGLPEHYTDQGLLNGQRQSLISKAWSVPVLCEILKPLKELFSQVC